MTSVNLTSTSDGSVRFATSNDNVPVFLVIGDSFAMGTTNAHDGEDQFVSEDYRYHCKNFQRTFNPNLTAALPDAGALFQVWDQFTYQVEAAPWADTGFSPGDSVANGGTGPTNQYYCIKEHAGSTTAVTQPGSGSDWESYWVQSPTYSKLGTAADKQGRTYQTTGTSGFNWATGACRPRASLAQSGSAFGFGAATFSAAGPFTHGLQSERAAPVDGYSFNQHTNGFIRDTNALYGFNQYMVYNGVFKDADGGPCVPKFVISAQSGAAIVEAAAAFRRLSWSANALASKDENPAIQVTLWEQFHDMYLKPALNEIITTDGDNAWLAGIIIMTGGTECRTDYNKSTSPIFADNGSNNRPAQQYGQEVVDLIDAVETACSVTNIPVMVMNPVKTPELGESENGSSRWQMVGQNSIAAALEGSDYRTSFSIQPTNISERHTGKDNYHFSAEGGLRIGYELADNYYTSFIDRGLAIETATVPSAYLT
jgi:hypothetical protein